MSDLWATPARSLQADWPETVVGVKWRDMEARGSLNATVPDIRATTVASLWKTQS